MVHSSCNKWSSNTAMRRLFGRSTQLATALKIKNCVWDSKTYAELLTRIADYSSSHPTAGCLDRDTLRALQGPLRTVRTPLERTICLDMLAKLGQMDERAAISSFLNSYDIELAVHYAHADSLDLEIANRLIDSGAYKELARLISDGWRPDTDVWNRLFQHAVDEHNTRLALDLWNVPKRHAISLGTATRYLRMIGEVPDSTDLVLAFLKRNDTNELLDKLPFNNETAGICVAAASGSGLEKVLSALQEVEKAKLPVKPGEILLACDLLSSSVMTVLALPENPNGLLLWDALLVGLLKNHAALIVFHVYRILIARGFHPSRETAQTLANAARRLGNSKLLAHAIWVEFVEKHNIRPTRKLCETLLSMSMEEKGVRSSLYFLYQMRRRNISLRGHVQKYLAKCFNRAHDSELARIFNDMHVLDKYASFDKELAIRESMNPRQTYHNVDVFHEGCNPEKNPMVALREMLDLENSSASGKSS